MKQQIGNEGKKDKNKKLLQESASKEELIWLAREHSFIFILLKK